MEQETAKINQNFLISVVKYGMTELNQNVLLQVYIPNWLKVVNPHQIRIMYILHLIMN